MGKRTSLTLERADEEIVAPFTHDSAEREALSALDPGVNLDSEAAVLRALIRVGADAVRDMLLEAGYAQMAEEHRSHDAERQVLRQRRTARDAHRD